LEKKKESAMKDVYEKSIYMKIWRIQEYNVDDMGNMIQEIEEAVGGGGSSIPLVQPVLEAQETL
jgi:hypothetical protein